MVLAASGFLRPKMLLPGTDQSMISRAAFQRHRDGPALWQGKKLHRRALLGSRVLPWKLKAHAGCSLHPGPDGEYQTNVEAESVQTAVRAAIRFFSDPFWKGPKPGPDTEYRVSRFYGEHRTWRVRARDLKW
jgi:hypothetical protein